jgi:phosphomannomutase/phosphoglucomutase
VARKRDDAGGADGDAAPADKDSNAKAGGALTAGLWSYPLIAIAIALLGIAVAFALLWTTLVAPANDAHRDAQQAAHLDMYRAYFDSRTVALRRLIDASATSPETSAAFASFDPAVLAETGKRLAASLPDAERVDLVPLGHAAVDLSASTPISFAALDVIKRAETQEFVGPEASQVNERPLFYVARPVTNESGVAGVLFAAISMDYFFQPLKTFPDTLGLVAIEQQFEGAPPRVVMHYGSDPGEFDSLRAKLAAPNWQLSFEPDPKATADVARSSRLWTPLAVALGLLLAGVYLGFSRLFGTMEKDAINLIDFVTRMVRGRGATPSQFQLSLFQQIADAAGRFARRVPRDRTDAAGTPPPAKPATDAAPKATATKPAKVAKAVAPPVDEGEEDFLDVRSNVKDDNFGIEVSEDNSPVAMGLALDPTMFRAYDIRGIVGKNLTPDVVYWVGRAFAAESAAASRTRVVIARDGRDSSKGLSESLARGLREGGMDVMDAGLVPTPLLYYATHALDTGTGVMITGSHNPPEYNGLKMMIAGETLAEERIQRLRTRIERNDLSTGAGEYEEVEIIDHYVDRVVSDVAVAQPLKVVVDCGNGVAGVVAPRLLRELGCDVVPLYCEVDGRFPNHHPDPADPHNLEDLIAVVKDEKADLGLAFDGDGDRLGVVTNTGEIIWPDKLLMLFARDIVGRNPGADIIFDVKCSRHLNSIVSEYGGRPIMWKTGHSHMKAKLKETGALLAGEFSGHICFGERWFGFDDALYSAARLLEIVGAESQHVDALFAEFPVTFTTPEIKVATTEKAKFDVMARLAKEGQFGNGTLTTIDGIRVDYSDGWGLVRPSNTSPVLTLRFEADGQSALDRIQKVFRDQLGKIDSTLKF